MLPLRPPKDRGEREDRKRCRLCLKVSADVIHIFREDFPKMIKFLTSIQVQLTDNFPKVACITCTRKVKSAMIMRKQIIRSHRTLMEEALAKKRHPNISNFIINSETSKNSSKSFLDNNLRNVERGTKLVSPEIILLKVENHTAMKEEEEVIFIDSPEDESNISTQKQISDELNEKNIQNLRVSLDKSEISIVRINKSKSDNSTLTETPALIKNTTTVHISKRRGPKPKSIILTSNPLIVRNIEVPARRNPKIFYKPLINVEPPKRRGPKPKPPSSKYNPLTPIPCKICQKSIQKTNMKKHLETHDKKIVKCHLCGKVTKNTSLRAHIFYFHKCKEDEYVCDQCGRHFRYRNKFNLHMKKQHGGTKDFECTICGRKFFERKYLTKHIDSHHKKIRPFICDYCGKNFSTKHALKVHLRQHTESAPYCCDSCGRGFRQNVSLKTHRKQAHDIYEEETVFCEVCGKGFASMVALTSHFRLHERKKCLYCAEIFVRDDYLERHVQDKHGTTALKSEDSQIEADKGKNVDQGVSDNVDDIVYDIPEYVTLQANKF